MPKSLQDYIDEEYLRLLKSRQGIPPEAIAPSIFAPTEPEPALPEAPQWALPQPAPQLPQWAIPIRTAPTAPQGMMELETPPEPVSPKAPVKPYELPKVWAEQAMEAVGGGISKVPILPKVLEFISPVFEFIHEKLEKPFASIITSPFSPNIPWRQGESWLEHEKREFETWEAPTYVKGLAEFAMPLWWLPWFGWAGKGLKSLGVGDKMARALATAGKFQKVEKLPSSEMLDQTIFKLDPFRRFSLWAEDKPVLSGVVRTIGGPSAFVHPTAIDPVSTMQREVVKRAVIYDMRHGAQGLILPKLQRHGDPTKLLDMNERGLVGAIKSAPEGASRYIYDVIEHPENIIFKTKEAKAYIDEVRGVINEIKTLAGKEGIQISKAPFIHRIVKGKEFAEGFQPSEFGSLFEVKRIHPTMESGVKAGVVYGINPNESIASSINYYFRKIGDKRLSNGIAKLGKTPKEWFAEINPVEAIKITEFTARQASAKYALQAVTRILSFKGTTLPPATLGKIRSGLPDLADVIERTLSLAPKSVQQIITNVSRELKAVTKLNPQEFLLRLGNPDLAGKYTMGQISRAVKEIAKDKSLSARLIERIHKQAYKLNKAEWDTALKDTQTQVKNILATVKSEVRPELAMQREFLLKFQGKEVFWEKGKLAAFRNPYLARIFKNKFFDEEAVELAEKVIGDRGQQWLKSMGMVSGTGRMLVAALDFSAPFIQGLPLLGRNPIGWLKAVKKQYEFFVKPQNLYNYMTKPEVMAIAQERWFYGGSRSTFEFFEALAPLQRAVGAIPKVGVVGKRAIAQTYGRAEAAFSGFGEVARNEIWKALKRPNMTDDELRQLARATDRMTGVMSMEALAVGRTQTDFENAFAFFAPRYTRAGLAFVSDVFRGGLTGAEARKTIGSLMASGFVMYYGISKALGQEPNLDPKSAKFLTVKIGDSYVGVGGIMYSLIRFGSNLLALGIDPEARGNFQLLSRQDNPFIKFMYQRTSPLTGSIVNLMEQKNYFGEPFEDIGDWAKFLAEKVTPIAAQRFWEEGEMTPAIFAAEIAGARTFPKSSWELRDEARERVSQRDYQMSYITLSELNQRQIDRSPEVIQLQEQVDKETAVTGRALSKGFLERRRDREDAYAMYVLDLNQAQAGVDNGFLTTYEFRERMKLAQAGLRATYEHIDRNPRYKEVLEKLQEPQDINKKFIGDIAYEEYISQVVGGTFEDEYGIFDYEAYNQLRDELRAKYGEGIWDYILAREKDSRQKLPPLAQQWYQARDILKPYWEITDQVNNRGWGKKFSETKMGQRLITRLRRNMRLGNPEIAQAVAMFYTQ